MSFLPAPTTFCCAAGRGSDRGKSIELQANCLAELAIPPASKWRRLAGVIAAVVAAAVMFSAAHAAQDSTPVVPTPKAGQVSTAGTANAKLALFQDFVNGKVPVKEAVVYREITKPGGIVVNREWWRFGCQENTWYVQRLHPDTNDPSALVPLGNHQVGGASYTHLWIIDDRNVHLAAKESAEGSLLTKAGLPSLLQTALSLGLPRKFDELDLADARIEWNGKRFRSTSYLRGDSGSLVTVTNEGEVTTGVGEFPVSAKWSRGGRSPAGATTYEYADTTGIPSGFVEKYLNPPREYRYRFLMLSLGSNDLSSTEGYVPTMFADFKLQRDVAIWTNRQGYALINGKLVSMERPSRIYGEGSKRKGPIVLISLVFAVGTILAVVYRRTEKQKQTNK